ncbi:CopG family transcriptional regulator [Crocosphaera sp. XPORK-15E]|uniref:CopG family transcriptional regulator n=1 Tax=Crocosphaera sp. XPORK-15E TaxID=3110247 RepID=UPI002B201986|nr:CopG family transcriptional regulator [Crocosphaera sp. XPORK-15E]MEA5536753.1 CopG family transcriptional regulator [Crocosphaera sp. XPORK-15E]
MMKNINLSPEIESRLSIISQKIGLGEDELIVEAIINYSEDFEDIKDAQERLLNPPDHYLSLEEVEKELSLRLNFR